MDCAVHGNLQARVLEWAAFPFSRGSSQPRDGTQVSHIAGGFFTSWATREAPDVAWETPIKGAEDGMALGMCWNSKNELMRCIYSRGDN